MISEYDLYVFVRSLPEFSGNIFEELERLRPYVHVVEVKPGQPLVHEEGCSIVYGGRIRAFNGAVLTRLGKLYHPPDDQGEAMEPSLLVFFPKSAISQLLRKEPELGLPLAEKMREVEEAFRG